VLSSADSVYKQCNSHPQMEGRTQVSRSLQEASYIPGNGNPGTLGGGTYTGTSLEPIQSDWENIFGPAGRDVKLDNQRQKRHQRWHLPDVLKGPNVFLTDRVDGLITDTTNSPFTTVILPYKYIENPDAKIKWNAWSFDEGLATRVPYESAARVLTQTKRSYAAFAVRHGLGIEMEHNFMMSAQGMQNFQNQVKQLVGSVQMSNDLDVHIALVQAPSYAKEFMERYSSTDKTPYQICREFVDLFGMVQKNPNALDILIEEAKIQLRTWGSPEPNFLLCNSKLTFNLQMTPERTNYLTQGIDGVKRLRQVNLLSNLPLSFRIQTTDPNIHRAQTSPPTAASASSTPAPTPWRLAPFPGMCFGGASAWLSIIGCRLRRIGIGSLSCMMSLGILGLS